MKLMLKFKSITVLTLEQMRKQIGKTFTEHSSMQIWGDVINIIIIKIHTEVNLQNLSLLPLNSLMLNN